MLSRIASRRGIAALLATGLLAVPAAGCGGGDDSPSSEDVPSGSVATVGDVKISKKALDERVAELARAQRMSRRSAGAGDGKSTAVAGGSDAAGSDAAGIAKQSRAQLASQALSMLLMREALEQEAASRGIEVDNAEVREQWETVSKGQFKTKKALKRFLGGLTVANVLSQLRLQALTERIHEQVAEEAGGGKEGAEAVKKFQKEFQKRWRERTACAEGYDAAGCKVDKP